MLKLNQKEYFSEGMSSVCLHGGLEQLVNCNIAAFLDIKSILGEVVIYVELLSKTLLINS